METNEKMYVYASKEAQVKRANRFAQIGYLIFYAFVLMIQWVSYASGARSLGVSLMVTGIIAAAFLAGAAVYLKSSTGILTRYVSFAGLLAVAYLTAVTYENSYIRFLACIPLVGCILYFDIRYAMISGILMVMANLAANFVAIQIEHRYTQAQAFDQVCTTLTILHLMVIIYVTTKIAWLYNHDTTDSLKYEQEKQKEMMDNVLMAAEEVRRGTEGAMDIVSELNDSSGVVSSSVQDISNSTQSTADSIQTQTEMTQNIQASIQQTLEYAENMVQVAKNSEELNRNSLRMMESLKKQSESISRTNQGVAVSMEELQERAGAVKTIADTIFGISNQTNLLALNASIESARAGEAGRGFAVVADEIRKLAEKTRQETESIAGILNELSENAQSAAEAVSKSIEAAAEQDGMIAQVSQSFEEINSNVAGLISSIGNIDSMLNLLSDSNNRIVDDITHLSSATEEVTASSMQASELSMQNMQNAESTKEMLSRVLDASHRLDQYMP
ncbi:MAG: hypothetical protein HFH30_03800 [Eubacterium sp.]|nr:hypothetical protein [Eubacterium sp.]MCI8917289.1 hypothetical protein [Eubacterium sp.]